jgi:hypothetical protein
VSDPADPVVVSRMPNLDPFQSYVHSIQVAHLDGRRLVVTTSEYGYGALRVYDATDLAAPRLAGVWTRDVPLMPLHNLQVVADRAYVAALHAGLFAFNLSQLPDLPVPTRLEPAAHLAPEGDGGPGTPTGFGSYYGPRDVIVRDGVLWVTETTMGLRSVADGCLAMGDASLRSTG